LIEPIDVRDLFGRPGTSKLHKVAAPVDELQTELAGVRDDQPVDVDLLLESLVEGILVSGTLRGTFALRCASCLKEFDQPFDVSVHEMFVIDPEPDTDDYPLDPEGMLDPGQMVRDAVGVELPFSPLCRPDCQGLCPVCGGDKNADECPGHAEVDPRWAALDRLVLEDN